MEVKNCFLSALCFCAVILSGCAAGRGFGTPIPTGIAFSPLGLGAPASQVEPIVTVPRHLRVSRSDSHYYVEERGQVNTISGGPVYVNGRWVDVVVGNSYTYGFTNSYNNPYQYRNPPNYRPDPGSVRPSYIDNRH